MSWKEDDSIEKRMKAISAAVMLLIETLRPPAVELHLKVTEGEAQQLTTLLCQLRGQLVGGTGNPATMIEEFINFAGPFTPENAASIVENLEARLSEYLSSVAKARPPEKPLEEKRPEDQSKDEKDPLQ